MTQYIFVYFRILMKENSQLIAVHEGKYFKRSDGLAVGPGCFTRGLEYSTGKKATIIGKPNPYFFNNAIPKGLSTAECCMIGDVSISNSCQIHCDKFRLGLFIILIFD